MNVYIDIDGTVLYHRALHGRALVDPEAPKGWSGQRLCDHAAEFFQTVCRLYEPAWLTAWPPEKIKANLLPYLPACASKIPYQRWLRSVSPGKRRKNPATPLHDAKTCRLPTDTPWVWLDDDFDPVLEEEYAWVVEHDVNVVRVDAVAGRLKWETLHVWSPWAILVCDPTCPRNLLLALDYLEWHKEITDAIQPLLGRAPVRPQINFDYRR